MSGLGNLGKNFEDVVAPVAAMVLLNVPPGRCNINTITSGSC